MSVLKDMIISSSTNRNSTEQALHADVTSTDSTVTPSSSVAAFDDAQLHTVQEIKIRLQFPSDK